MESQPRKPRMFPEAGGIEHAIGSGVQRSNGPTVQQSNVARVGVGNTELFFPPRRWARCQRKVHVGLPITHITKVHAQLSDCPWPRVRQIVARRYRSTRQGTCAGSPPERMFGPRQVIWSCPLKTRLHFEFLSLVSLGTFGAPRALCHRRIFIVIGRTQC